MARGWRQARVFDDDDEMIDATIPLHLQALKSFAVTVCSYTNISQVLGKSRLTFMVPPSISHSKLPLFPTNWARCVPRDKPPIPTRASHVPCPHPAWEKTPK